MIIALELWVTAIWKKAWGRVSKLFCWYVCFELHLTALCLIIGLGLLSANYWSLLASVFLCIYWFLTWHMCLRSTESFLIHVCWNGKFMIFSIYILQIAVKHIETLMELFFWKELWYLFLLPIFALRNSERERLRLKS